ncbi:MAG: tetratricopeptide (TPR) repeat protein [Planctomycetota bacterium]|jgi:tetratricopeptide (TPR) repeat protein
MSAGAWTRCAWSGTEVSKSSGAPRPASGRGGARSLLGGGRSLHLQCGPVSNPNPTLCVFLLVSLLLGLGCADGGGEQADHAHSQEHPSHAAYVDSASCAECHADQAKGWQGSHHDLAMQPADESTVLGDFEDASFESLGLVTRFFRRDGGYWVNAEGPDGQLQDYAIDYVFGVEPLQQYLISFPGGRLQCLTVAWDTDDKRWFSLYPEDRFAPDDTLHWTGRFQNWNLMCADCHSTHLRKNYDPATDTYDTTWHEIDVGCQACHGPGSEHVELARAAGAGWQPKLGESGLAVSLRRGDQQTQLDSCAACHSRRSALTTDAYTGRDFHDRFGIEPLRESLYYADGQMQDEVYVMGSFMQSRMHKMGVACSDCHDPHSLDLWVPGDGVCMQCHSESAPLDRFETLTVKNYASPEHHHHAQDSEGARCVACHMPERTYMQIDERYDHSLRIPRPDLSEAIGTPNACNACHEDQTPAWAAAAIKEWTGEEPAPHVGPVFAAGRIGHPAAAQALAGIAMDPEQAGIVRATALDLLGAYPGAEQVKLAALGDADALVRSAALDRLEEVPLQVRLQRIQPLLADPVRRVRIAAARALAGQAGQVLEAQGDTSYAQAKAELLEVFEANADTPSASLNYGTYLADCGDQEGAAEAYLRALYLDQDFLPAVFNLANLLSSTGRAPAAKELLAEALVRHPEEGELHYSMGLLLGQMQEMEACAEALVVAARRLPDRARVHYNLGLVYQQLERGLDAEAALSTATDLEPGNPDFVYALANLYLTQSRYGAAMAWAKKLAELVPEEPGPAQFMAEIERRQAAGE